MTKEKKNVKDQANSLREQVEETESIKKVDDFKEEQLDILNLPPRKIAHQNIHTKMKYKIKGSTLRFIIVLIILLTLSYLAILLYK